MTYIYIYSDRIIYVYIQLQSPKKKLMFFSETEIPMVFLSLHSQDEVQQLLVITFSAQGAPVAQGQAEVRALRDAMLKAPGSPVRRRFGSLGSPKP